jgi:hypothetical protein
MFAQSVEMGLQRRSVSIRPFLASQMRFSVGSFERRFPELSFWGASTYINVGSFFHRHGENNVHAGSFSRCSGFGHQPGARTEYIFVDHCNYICRNNEQTSAPSWLLPDRACMSYRESIPVRIMTHAENIFVEAMNGTDP